jgi:hypothetical protein
MKPITKFVFLTVVAAVGTGVAPADDQNLRNRLDIQRQERDRMERSTTIDVYAIRRDVSHRPAAIAERTGVRLEWRTNAHGQIFPVFVPEE